MREEDTNRQVPVVIDVDAKELIAVDNEPEVLGDMSVDFELREPDIQANEKSYEKNRHDHTEKEQTHSNRYDEIKYKEVSKKIEEKQEYYQEIERDYEKKQDSPNTEGDTSKEDKQSKGRKDTSFKAFKSKQYESERKWRQKASHSMKSFIGKLLFIVLGIPFFIAAAGSAIFAGGFGVFFGVMFLGLGILGIGFTGFLTASNAGAIAAVAGYGSVLLIGLSSLGLLLLWRILVWIKSIVVVGYKKLRR